MVALEELIRCDLILRGAWILKPNFMAVCSTAVDTFHSTHNHKCEPHGGAVEKNQKI